MIRIKSTLFYVILISILAAQSTYSQNLLFLHDKIEKADIFVNIGKKIKIETIDNKIIKGKLAEIKDSSVVIDNGTQTEIKLTNIKYFHYRSSSGWKTAGGVLLAFYAGVMTVFVYTGLTQNTRANTDPNVTYDNPIPGMAIVGAIAIPALYAGTYFALFHKKKYNTLSRYELNVVKHK